MNVTMTVVTVLQVLTGLLLIAFVLMQSGKHSGLGVIGGGGGSDSFLSKNKAKTLDAKLARFTKWVALIFVLLTLSLSLL